MGYRTVTFSWMPHSRPQWEAFTASRREAARLWNDLSERHARIRRRRLKWPSKSRWEKWAKGKYPGLHSQSVQHIIGEFCEAVSATVQLHKNGHPEANFPKANREYRDVPYTNQSPRFRDGNVIFPNGKSGNIVARIPNDIEMPGRLMEARVSFGAVLFVCEVGDPPPVAGPSIGVDIGVNTLLAATDGDTAVLVSGREAKATIQWRAKRLASLSSKQSNCHRGSRQYGKLQRRKHKLLKKSENRVRDVTHKATRLVAETFPGAACYVGEPFNDAARKLGRRQAQQVSSVCGRKLIAQLGYKTSGATTVPEHYTSQTCPVCGERNKCQRTYHCRNCGLTAPRDVVGSSNIRVIGLEGYMVPGRPVPDRIQWRRPLRCKYPGESPGSSGGHPASSLRKQEAA